MQETITRLIGPDRIRKRPSVIFGSADSEGVKNAVRFLIDIFVDEAVNGHSEGIKVTIHKDDSVSIHSQDRGFIIDETPINGRPAWQGTFCDMFCGPREADENYFEALATRKSALYENSGSPIQNYCTDTSADCIYFVQAASEFMNIEATRKGEKKTLRFEKGFPVCDPVTEKCDGKSGTLIHFLADKQVFEDTGICYDDIKCMLSEVAITVPGLKCEIYDERKNGNHDEFIYANGIIDYANQVYSPIIPAYTKELEARGKDRYNTFEYDAHVKVLVAFVKDAPETVCFHNFKRLTLGGEHALEAEKQVGKYIGYQFGEGFSKVPLIIVESKCSFYATAYENASKKSICNRMISDMTKDLFDEDFSHYLKQNKEKILG